MLDKVILTSSFELGAHYASQKKALVANSNSLLGQLVNLSAGQVSQDTSTMPPEQFTPEFVASLADTISEASTGSLEAPSLHDNAIGQVVDTLSTAVAAHISIARNVVKPHVMEFITEYAEYVNRTKVTDPASSFNIVQKELPSVFEDESFIEQFKYYEGKVSIIPKTFVDLSSASIDVNSLMVTGSARIDKMLQEAVLEMGENYVQDVFDAFLTYKSKPALGMSYENIGQQNLYDALYASLVLYVISQKLYANVPENVGNVDLSSYQDHMLQVRDFAGTMVNVLIKRAYFMIKNNTLVLKSDNAKRTIYVQGSVYRAFLEQGGTVEMVLGICASNSGLTSMASVLDARELLARGWNSYCTFAAISAENARLDNTKMYLLTAFNSQMSNLSDVEKEYLTKDSQYVVTASKEAAAYVADLKLNDLDSLGEISLNLMARCRFYFTAGYQILAGIDQATKASPELDPREAALVSAINYVTDFLVDQIAPTQS